MFFIIFFFIFFFIFLFFIFIQFNVPFKMTNVYPDLIMRVFGVLKWYHWLVTTICTNLIVNGTIGKEIGVNGKHDNTIGNNG